ncbi:hypothetical protein D9619_002284 [Psilocybe cf. subviscida]|uniref:Uncharacterized protein n=1 Tax=Psilocybe cf. subviscida TaxID=2480587 RepID=A0A8H5BEV7_9AGAR|nr:hypothetical protein D9619_002284 [Psilocybe cf. subviscida]
MNASIMWLTGEAGTGKSAIAQTMAESFFVATIVYQLYRTVPPPSKEAILGAVNDDPLVFTKSVTA